MQTFLIKYLELPKELHKEITIGAPDMETCKKALDQWRVLSNQKIKVKSIQLLGE